MKISYDPEVDALSITFRACLGIAGARLPLQNYPVYPPWM